MLATMTESEPREMTGEPDVPADAAEPIDADFEPAPEPEKDAPKPRSRGLGWFGAILLGSLSAAGGAAAMVAAQRAGIAPPEAVVSKVDRLAASQRDAELRLGRLSDALQAAETRLSQQAETLSAGGAPSDALQSLIDDLGVMSGKLDAVVASGFDPDALADLAARVEQLEEADASESATSPRLLNRDVLQLRDRVDALEAANDPDDLIGRIDALEAALAGLRDDLSTQAAAQPAAIGPSALAALQAQIDALRETGAESSSAVEAAQRSAEAAISAADAAVALSAVETLARRGRPFEAAMTGLVRAFPGDPHVETLARIAPTGAPTTIELRDGFDVVADRALAASATSNGSDGWAWVRNVFGDAATVRRTDASPDGTKDTIETAQRSVVDGKLDDALTGLAELDGAAVEAFADWRDAAQRRIDLDNALDALSAGLVER